MNRSHPDFDLALELLILLPPEPGYVFCADLVNEKPEKSPLELKCTMELVPLIANLNNRGLKVRQFNKPNNGRAVQIDRDCWGKGKTVGIARAAAEGYYDRVYRGCEVEA